MCAVISRDSRTMRENSHAGARPPCSGSWADPVLTITIMTVPRCYSYGVVPVVAFIATLARPTWTRAALYHLYGGLLRLDAFTAKYGTLDHPAWARIMHPTRSHRWRATCGLDRHWGRVARPYVGGDPIRISAVRRAP